MHDNDTHSVMSLVMHTAEHAFNKLAPEDQNYLLLIEITVLSSILNLQEGDFKAAEEKAAKALQLMKEHDLPEGLTLTNAYNHLGLACDSIGEHDKAKAWLEKSADILKKGDDDAHTRLACQNNLNRARNLYCKNNFKEAEDLIDKAFAQATEFKSWYSLA